MFNFLFGDRTLCGRGEAGKFAVIGEVVGEFGHKAFCFVTDFVLASLF